MDYREFVDLLLVVMCFCKGKQVALKGGPIASSQIVKIRGSSIGDDLFGELIESVNRS